jgi:ribokinase
MSRLIAVAGSLNMDFVATVPRLPAPGETLTGSAFQTVPGGKGANQANAAGRLGGNVWMAGRTGSDVFGAQLRASLSASGVDVSEVRDAATTTGVALIEVEASGQNSIVVIPGANAAFSPADAAALEAKLAQSAFLLLQLETPLATVLRLASLASGRVLLDPAPAQPLPAELLRHVAVLTPNESEARILLGQVPGPVDPADAPALARRLRELGPSVVVLKLGANGCYALGPDLDLHTVAFPVAPVDTTAAGDTFNAALAVALAENRPWPEALRFANAAAALSVTRLGAQSSAPDRAEVLALLGES